MAFKLALTPTYSVEVTVEYPIEDGKTQRAKFFARFKRLKQEEIEDLLKRAREARANDRQILEEVLVGWKGVQDEAGEEIPFTPENMATVMNVYPMQPATVRAFFDSVQGARQGN